MPTHFKRETMAMMVRSTSCLAGLESPEALMMPGGLAQGVGRACPSPSCFPSHCQCRADTHAGWGEKGIEHFLIVTAERSWSDDNCDLNLASWMAMSAGGRKNRKKALLWAGRMCPGFHKSFEQFHGFHWIVSSKNRNQRQILSPSWTRRYCLVCSASRFSEFLTILVHLKLMTTERKRRRANVTGISTEGCLAKFVKIKMHLPFDPETQLLGVILTAALTRMGMTYRQSSIATLLGVATDWKQLHTSKGVG